jgi:hypothetical protein
MRHLYLIIKFFKRLFDRLRRQPHILLKRSLSPSGRIDCVSIEITLSIGDMTGKEIKEKALSALRLQSEIAKEFLKNGSKL